MIPRIESLGQGVQNQTSKAGDEKLKINRKYRKNRTIQLKSARKMAYVEAQAQYWPK